MDLLRVNLMSLHGKTFLLQVCVRAKYTIGIYEFSYVFFFISRRVEVDKKNQHPARHLNNYGLQQTIFHVSPTDGVGHKRRGGLNFSDDPLFSSFTVAEVGSNYGIRMVIKFLRNTW